jgi:hypothetical protein
MGMMQTHSGPRDGLKLTRQICVSICSLREATHTSDQESQIAFSLPSVPEREPALAKVSLCPLYRMAQAHMLSGLPLDISWMEMSKVCLRASFRRCHPPFHD